VKRLRHDESGSILPLTIFYGFLALVLILLVVAATSLYLERKRLFSLADSAALAGAEAFTLDGGAVTAGGARPSLQSRDVASAVDAFLAAAPSDEFTGLEVVEAASHDGRSATVTLSSYWRPPLVTLLVPEGLRIEVTARARSVFD
jgi:uncharacterized membrane protein